MTVFKAEGLTLGWNAVTLTITLASFDNKPIKILTASEMQRIERRCAAAGISTDALMENAGKAVAAETGRVLGGALGKHILILAGPGNNGGDGLVAARRLHDRGALVCLFMPEQPSHLERLEPIAARGIEYRADIEWLKEVLPGQDAVIDAFFGTGSNRPIGGAFKAALEAAAKARKSNPAIKLIALDVPSGLDADTGACDSSCLSADYTVTLGFPKRGLFNPPGAGRAGEIIIADIGIPAGLAEEISLELMTESWARSALPGRPADANKGDFGRVLVVAGSAGFTGAAYLAASGAMRSGAGLVTLAIASSLDKVLAAKLTEATHLPLPESAPGVVSKEASGIILSALESYDVLLIGCGLGQSQQTAELVRSVVPRAKNKLVIDADGLNILAKTPGWWKNLGAGAVLTPHPGEMARLVGATVEEVQKDRIGCAQKTAAEWGQTVVLKGAYTVIASPDGRAGVCPFANPGLASAGTGDVLAGAISGLWAQGLDNIDAVGLGVFLHGLAGEMARAEMGDAGLLAGDLLPMLPKAVKRLKEIN